MGRYAALEEALLSSGVLSLEDRGIDDAALSEDTQAPPPDASPQTLGALAADGESGVEKKLVR